MIIRDITAPNPGAFTLSGTRTYLLGESAIIDPGPAIDSHIEAIRIAEANAFALGVQWHAEYDPQKNPINRKLFEAFGQALAAHKRAA